MAILRTDLNADDKFHYIKQALKSNVSFTAEQKAFLTFHQAYQCFLSEKAQTKDKLFYIRSALRSPTAFTTEQHKQLCAAEASLMPRHQEEQENQPMLETEQPSHKHHDNVLSEAYLVEKQAAPDDEESNSHTIPTKKTDSLTVEAFAQEIKGRKISASQFNQIKELLKDADIMIDSAQKAILLERSAVYITFDSQRSNVEVVQAVEEALKYKKYLTNKKIAHLYYIRAFNMDFTEQYLNVEVAQAAEEALKYNYYLEPKQKAQLYYIRSFNMNFDKSRFNADRVQAAEKALEHAKHLTTKQTAHLYDIRAFNMSFSGRYSNAEIVRSVEEALEHQNHLEPKRIAQLYYIGAFNTSFVQQRSHAEKIAAINKALEYHNSLNQKQKGILNILKKKINK